MTTTTLTKKDFVSNQEVRWCPGCGDYAILSALQKTMPELGIAKEDIAIISGIGCSSRFPYYMDTFGFHTIHGRAPSIATGLRLVRPDLSVWVITGDGDALSIGGNHLIHVLRRNVDLNILLFNNEIYGLTKGQYSPTSQRGTVAKSTPDGSIDTPFSPVKVALGAGAGFVARVNDKDMKLMGEVFKKAQQHRGTSFIEIFQNCVIFNDGVHDAVLDKDVRDDNLLYLEHGKPMTFGKNNEKGIRIQNMQAEVIDAEKHAGEVTIFDERASASFAMLLAEFEAPQLPVPMGVIRNVPRPVYEEEVQNQLNEITAKKGKGDLSKLIHSGDTWEIK